MAVLETIRVKFGLAVTVIIAIGLLSFLISPNDIAALKDASNKQLVGNINGHDITAMQYENEKQTLSNLDSKYGLFGAQGQDRQAAVEQIAWGSLMSENLYNEYFQAAGFSVSDAEVTAAVKASFPSELRAQTTEDPSLKNFLKSQTRAQLYMSKYMSVFAGLANKTSLEVMDEQEAANKSVDVDFVKVAYPEFADVEVSDEDIQAYFDTHKSQFKNFVATRDLEYAYFRVLPSSDDVEAAKKDINLEADFDLIDGVWVKAGDLAGLPFAIESFVNDNNSGVSELVQDVDRFYAVKVLGSANRSAEVSLKCVPVVEGDVESLKGSINAGNIETVAEQNGSQVIPLSLNNATAAQYPGFDAAFDKKVGDVFDVDFQGAEYVVLVSEKSAPVKMKNVAVLEKDIFVSNRTLDSYKAKADKFAAIAAETGLDGALDSLQAEVSEAVVASESRNLGSINGAEKIVAWAFDAAEGVTSEAFQVNYDYFVVACVKAIHDKGYKNLSEVTDEVRQAVYQQKIAASVVAEVSAKAEGAATLEAVASATNAVKSTISGLRFSSLEADPVLTGAVAAALATGKTGVVGPVKGKDGVYFFQVKGDVKEEALYDEADAYRSMMTELQGISYGGQMLRAGYMQYLQPEIEFHSTVKDDRLSLYR